MTRYRISLEQRRYAPATINLRLAAVRRLAYEASDWGLLSPDLAAGIRRVKGAKRLGFRVGNWYSVEQGKALIFAPVGLGLRNRLMAWDTQETRRRLQQAACTEFTAHGPDGTTMARIATVAGFNKERLYNYFGDKRRLFATVLIEELEKLATSLGANAPGLEDIGEYTGCIFDYHAENPQLVRLLVWEGLSDGPAVNEAARTAHYQRTVAMFAEAQRGGTLNADLDPAKLVFLLVGMAAWWFAVPQLSRVVTGSDGSASTDRSRRRACVVNAAQHLASPRP